MVSCRRPLVNRSCLQTSGCLQYETTLASNKERTQQ